MESMSNNSIASRTVSAFPLSIGTSLALESVFDGLQEPYDPAREIPQKVNISNYNELWINVSTLFRNMTGSLNKEGYTVTQPLEYLDGILMEIEVIKGLLKQEGADICKPVFYHCTYNDIYKAKEHQSVKLRHPQTELQLFYKTRHDETMKKLLKASNEIRELNTDLNPKQSTKGLILTHLVPDLLSHKKFMSLDLLESHTGVLKPKHLWYTKYSSSSGIKNSSITLPFLHKLLKIFGDNEFYHPMDIRLRKMLIEIGEKKRWTSLTTESKLVFDVEIEVKDRFIVELFKLL